MMYSQWIISQDEFYLDPHAIRERALSLTYTEPPSQLSPDRRGPIARYAPADSQTQDETLARLIPMLPAPITDIIMEFRYCHGGTQKRQTCHADAFEYAGIIYLTLPEHCQGGTSFFRHLPTGHLRRKEDMIDTYDFVDPEQWQRSYEAEMQFNRLVMYPGDLFHAIGTPYFGDSVENARLTLTIFVNLEKTAN